MRAVMPYLLRLFASMLLAIAAGCARTPSDLARVKDAVDGPPDLVRPGTSHPDWRGYQVRNFQLNHVWSGPAGLQAGGQTFRAKITIWDYADDGSSLAEVYFDDTVDQLKSGPNPNQAKRPYQLHFPMSAFGPILATLRNSNEPVFLYFGNEAWAVGTLAPESVGVD
jgi:hypothetical protein